MNNERQYVISTEAHDGRSVRSGEICFNEQMSRLRST